MAKSSAILFLLAAGSLFGQSSALERLAHEAERVKSTAETSTDDHTATVAPLHVALREWIESRLPKNKERLAVEISNLQASMRAELHATLGEPADPPPDDSEYPGFGYAGVNLTRMPDLPDTLIVTAAATVPCGDDQAIYAYQFDAKGWKLTLALPNRCSPISTVFG